MANLRPMPTIVLPTDRLVAIGKHWKPQDSELPKAQGQLAGTLCDETVGNALATMLGGISVLKPKMNSLLPAGPDCVEVGPTRVIGGSYVSKYETGERRLDFVETANVCEALGITIQLFSKRFTEKAGKSDKVMMPTTK